MSNYDFTQHYKKKEVVYEVDINECVIRKLKLRTVLPTYMVGVIDKGATSYISFGKKDLIFKTLMDAKMYADQLGNNFEIEVIRDVPDDKDSEE